MSPAPHPAFSFAAVATVSAAAHATSQPATCCHQASTIRNNISTDRLATSRAKSRKSYDPSTLPSYKKKVRPPSHGLKQRLAGSTLRRASSLSM